MPKMTTSAAGKLGGISRSEAKRAASARNLALARDRKSALSKLPKSTRLLLTIFNEKDERNN
jgi:hypothetical protein